MFQLEEKVRRFDVARAFECAFEQNEWKGDIHHKGVFFTTEKAYCVNKVLAICAQHEEQSKDVYYRFDCDCLEEKVVHAYPFSEMDTRPKKHHLLFDDEQLDKGELEELFAFSTDGEIFFSYTPLLHTLHDALPNKRERDRTYVDMAFGDVLSYRLYRPRKGERHLVAEGELDVVSTFLDNEQRQIRLNANTLHTTLQVFDRKSEVSFQLAHDRIKITGELSTLEGRRTQVCAVLALLKG